MNKKCQVFTSENYVIELLDSLEYKKNLYGKKVLENSCGDGNILVAIVQRYIDDCIANGISRAKIRNGLVRDIYGIEIDKEQKEKCIKKLDIVLSKHNIKQVKWQIFEHDYLRWNTNIKFQYIIGNPPYIAYSDLEYVDQMYLKKNFKSCNKGKFDYCYAFIEKSLYELDVDGKIAYLVPSSIFKTVFGKNLRDIMKKHIIQIKDYPSEKIFNDVLVKSSIIVLYKNPTQKFLQYKEMNTNNEIDIPVERLGEKWFFTNENINGYYRFGDFFKVSHVVATLLNEAYVLTDGSYEELEEGYYCKGYLIERDVVRDTNTPRTLRYNKNEKIIFPYSYDNNGIIHYKKDEFESLFPGATAYLMTFKEKLDKRKKDKKAEWFEYGRSQALNGLNCRKLLMSTVVTNAVEVFELNQDCIPYAGMYISVRKDNVQYNLCDALNILQSDNFNKYVQKVGIPISGRSLRITSKDIEDYLF